MDTPELKPPAHQMEARLGNLLRTGVTLAAAVVVAGGVIYLSRHGHEQPAYHTFRGEPSGLRTVPGILQGAWQLRGREVIQAGLLVLIATPIARVAFAALGFARQHDWLYVGVAGVVLSLLLYAFLTGV